MDFTNALGLGLSQQLHFTVTISPVRSSSWTPAARGLPPAFIAIIITIIITTIITTIVTARPMFYNYYYYYYYCTIVTDRSIVMIVIITIIVSCLAGFMWSAIASYFAGSSSFRSLLQSTSSVASETVKYVGLRMFGHRASDGNSRSKCPSSIKVPQPRLPTEAPHVNLRIAASAHASIHMKSNNETQKPG